MPVAQWDVIVIGAGAAGLMCAAVAGQRGKSVLVLEKSNKPGKKILMSGGGRCNFTNYFVEPEHFLSANPHFVKSALSRYTQWDFIALVEKHGIPYHEKPLSYSFNSDGNSSGLAPGAGQLFCDNSAKDILNMLLEELTAAGGTLKTHCDIQQVAYQDGRFVLSTTVGKLFASAVVVASGGLSVPTLGGSGFGYEVAKQFGHQVLPQRAGLVPFTISDSLKPLCETLSGISTVTTVDCMEPDNAARESRVHSPSFTESMLFTHRGLSGPAILQISSYWQVGEAVAINLLPHKNANDFLQQLKRETPKQSLRKALAAESLPRKLVLELEQLWWPAEADKPLAEWSSQRLQSVAEQLNRWQIKPSGTEGYRTAEVTLGGVDTSDVSSKTMESQRQPGLFFIGEVLDVSGHLGGYNFQWAWSSAVAAGRSV